MYLLHKMTISRGSKPSKLRFEGQDELIQSFQELASSAKGLVEQDSALDKTAEAHLPPSWPSSGANWTRFLGSRQKWSEAQKRAAEANQGIASLPEDISRPEKLQARFETLRLVVDEQTETPVIQVT